MPSQQQKIRNLLRHERWCVLRSWCLGLGLLSLIIALGTLGLGGAGNPKNASSVYAAFAASGLLQSLTCPLLIFGFGALTVGVVIGVFLSRSRSGL
jgi:hypothetical protein